MTVPGPAEAADRPEPQEETVLIVDFGAQYSQLIARRVREARVYCEIVSHELSWRELEERRPRGLILTGGPASVRGDDAPRVERAVLESGIPILGICYGMQLMAHQLGGRVGPAPRREYGQANLELVEPDTILRDFVSGEQVWMSHGDLVEEPPPGFQVLARTENSPVAAMGDASRRLYGVQFHPEVVHTPRGGQLIERFLYDICGCTGNWTPGSFVEQAVAVIRQRIGAGRAVCGLSGGVDSAVAASLVHRAIGDRLTCIFVDHGLLRKGEAAQVIETFRDRLGMNVLHLEAAERFLARLAGVTDPEAKRRLIGETFVRVFEEAAAELSAGGEPVAYLVQGTVYPDVIESGTQHAAVIKTHHNVGGLPEEMKLEVVEPLRQLFKDEVRAVGRTVGLPEAVIGRHPFPGPGLAIRIIGPVTAEKLAILREADAIVREELHRSGDYERIWQAFAVLPSVRSVGVMGDERTYAYPIVLRAVTSRDGMTADWYRFSHEVLDRIARRVVNEVAHVNRLVYDVTSKPPGTIEWE